MYSRRCFLARAARLSGGAMLASLLAACAPAATPAAPKAETKPAEQKPATTAAPAATTAPAAQPAAPAAQPAAAKAAPSGSQPRRGGTVRAGYHEEHKTLDPHLSLQLPERWIFYAVFNTLVGTDESFNPQPELAESWTNPDPKTFVFKLRQGVKFHDGTDFNAEAVKWNVDRLKDPATKSPRINDLAAVANVEVMDPHTVKFNLTQPYAPLPAILMDRPGFILSPTAVQKLGPDFGRNPVGTGPFKFVQWTQGQGVTVERNPDYWNPAEPHVDKVEFRIVPDPTVRVTMLRSGELDLIDRFDTKDVATIQGDPNLKLVQFNGGAWHGFQWIVDKPPFDNKALRQAIAWGLNREALGKVHWNGYGRVPNGPVTIPWAGGDAVKPIGYDPAKAKSLLAEAGYANGFEETLTVRSRPDDIRLGELMQAQLAEIGVKVNLGTINPNEWTAAQAQRLINWTTTSWTQRADPDGLLSLLFKTNGTANEGGYSNPEVDQLLEKAAGIYDQEQRRPLYQQVQQILVDDAPYVYLWQPSYFYGLSKKVEGLQDIPDNILRVRTLWLSA
jgi:peptide/nickel transport system substrate-binding protein